MIRTLAFAGYRSLRELNIGVTRLTVVTGGNGAGKSNVYRGFVFWPMRPKEVSVER